MSKQGVKIYISKTHLRDFSRKIDKANSHVKEQVKKEFQMATLEVETKAKQRVPVDTGRLRSSIQSDFSNIGKFLTRVFTNVEYSKWIEFGSSRMKAKPFLNPAFQEVKAKLINNLKRIFKGKRF
ncbi:HK97-gp10 family putative phage morphogenesis protein [Catalinimonas sp. 4WD22]|uniref:HK97-gp10 family putative phage morphogenesis protein n=1 Tax=Catalinimonas locisalis TaxID=3133978 RepID=UPI003100C101